jgi:anti-sigma factor RsiW
MRKRGAARPLSARTCKELTALIRDYLTGRLPRSLKREFERHLRLCPDCVSFLKTYRKTAALGAALPPRALPAGVRDNVLEFLRRKMRRIGSFLLCLAGQLFG